METMVYQAVGRYLTFQMGREEYGVGVHRVREILGPVEMAAAPQGASHVRGMVRIRDKNVPVYDFRRRFGLEEAEASRENCVLLVQAKGWEGPSLIGILVDGVREVIQVDESNLEEAPAMEGDGRADFLFGLVQCPDRVVLLLDLDKLAQAEEGEEADEWN